MATSDHCGTKTQRLCLCYLKNTKRAVNNGKKFFRENALSKGKTEKVQEVPAVDLDELSYGFSPTIRKSNCNYKKLNTFKNR